MTGFILTKKIEPINDPIIVIGRIFFTSRQTIFFLKTYVPIIPLIRKQELVRPAAFIRSMPPRLKALVTIILPPAVIIGARNEYATKTIASKTRFIMIYC